MRIDLDEVAYIGETSVTIRNSRRRITIPKEVVEKLGISDGDRVRWVLFSNGSLSLSPVTGSDDGPGGDTSPAAET